MVKSTNQCLQSTESYNSEIQLMTFLHYPTAHHFGTHTHWKSWKHTEVFTKNLLQNWHSNYDTTFNFLIWFLYQLAKLLLFKFMNGILFFLHGIPSLQLPVTISSRHCVTNNISIPFSRSSAALCCLPLFSLKLSA